MPALKPTKFMTSSVPMAKALTRTCTWDRVHQPLTSGRCAAAAFCPMPLVRAISKGIRRQKNISKSVVSSFAMVPTEYVNSMTDSGELAPTSTCPKVNGDHVEISSGNSGRGDMTTQLEYKFPFPPVYDSYIDGNGPSAVVNIF